ncbi:Gfo/Idh/MocA family oxidoreductase [Lutimonas sp.]|uniref:Gfo/Idh/MocA family oxidoreductase n=1 Tax=Lutimonas sp. TaxID=1872403 RepID=UPI003D9B8B34
MKKHASSFKTQSAKESSETSFNDAISRRKFIEGAGTAAMGFTIVPSSVLGGKHIPPSDKINVAYIGLGTQGLRQLSDIIQIEDVQITAVCDPQRRAINYYDWGPTYLRDQMRELIGKPNWNTGGNNTIPGGLNNGKEIVDAYYAKTGKNYKSNPYTDFRELLEKEKDLDAIQVMTPDHLHGVICAAALKRDIAVSVHKPLANRLIEGKKVFDMALRSNATTHLQPWDSNGGDMPKVMEWIRNGAIGELEEVHNWSFRPVWPQYAKKPTDSPKLPEGFDWDLWLGPEANRPYHPHYTNMTFRGWYDFGGGSMADMGHYSLWTVFEHLKLGKPTIIEPNFNHVCGISEQGTAFKINNDFSFPYASSMRFKYPAVDDRPAIDLVWYDGGMRPPVPKEFYEQGVEFPSEGIMFKGSKGIIMTRSFRATDPYLLGGDIKKTEEVSAAAGSVKMPGIQRFIEGIKNGKQIEGGFRQAWPITEAVNLYAVALRSQKTLHYDAEAMKIKNNEKANEYLNREYRKGWGLDEV